MSRQLRLALSAAFLFLLVGCTAILIFLISNTPLFNRPVHSRMPVIWSSLPNPVRSNPNWRSYTNPHTIHDIALHEGLLWAATTGGVVVWDLQTMAVSKFTVEHGLAENVVTSTAVGPNGALWFGSSSGGLSRFDGTNWQSFTTADGLPSNSIRDIITSADGYLWAATDRGIVQYDGRQWFLHNRARSLFQLPSEEVRALAVAPDGVTLWAATSLGAARYNGTRWESLAQVGTQAINDLQDITITPDGKVWAASPGGLILYDGRNWDIFTSADGLMSEAVQQVTALPDNTLWLAYADAQSGLTQFDGTTTPPTTNHLVRTDVNSDTPLTSVFSSPQGLAVAATNTLFLQLGGGWRSFVLPHDFLSTTITDLEVQGNQIWISGNQGLNKFTGQNWQWYSRDDGLVSDEVTALTSDINGDLWLAYQDASQGVTRIDAVDGRLQTIPCLSSGPPSANIRQGVEAADGSLWFATNNGLSRFNGQTWQTFNEEDGLPSSAIQTLAAAPDGTIWVGTAVGLAHFDGTKWQTELNDDIRLLTITAEGSVFFITDEGIGKWQNGRTNLPIPPVSQVYDMLTTGSTLWLAAEEGLFQFNGRSWRQFNSGNELPASRSRALTLTADGSLLVATETNLQTNSHHLFGQYNVQHNYLSRLNNDQWQTTPLPLAYGLLHPVITDIVVAAGKTWLATLGGISSYDGEEWQAYTPFSGLPSAEVYSLTSAHDTIWAVTQTGIVKFAGEEATRPWQPIPELQALWPSGANVTLAVNFNGELWAGGDETLMRFDGVTWQNVALDLPAANVQIRSLAFAPDGDLWLAIQAPKLPEGERHFLGKWNGSKWEWHKLQPSAQFFAVDLMRFAPDGRLWLGNDNGLWLLDIPNGNVSHPRLLPDTREATDLAFLADGTPLFSQRYQTAVINPLTRETIEIPLIDASQSYALTPMSDGSIWVGTDQGVARLNDNGGWDLFPIDIQQEPPIITRITAVAEDNYLAGTFTGDILQYSAGATNRVTPNPLRPSSGNAPISALILGDDDTLWTATFGTGIARRQQSRWQRFGGSSPILDAMVTDLAVATDGTPWLATSRGPIKQSQHESEPICQLAKTELDEAIEAIAADFNGHIWLVSEGKFWQGNETGFERAGIQVSPITTRAPDGAIWVVTQRNLVRYANGRRQIIGIEGLPHNITALAIAPDNTIWSGTTEGAAFFDGRGWKMITAGDGLASNHVLHITIAPDNSVWFATSGGISHLVNP